MYVCMHACYSKTLNSEKSSGSIINSINTSISTKLIYKVGEPLSTFAGNYCRQ